MIPITWICIKDAREASETKCAQDHSEKEDTDYIIGLT